MALVFGTPCAARARSIERWWPEIEAFLELGVTNARTEGHNRVIKQVKRVACGFRNQANPKSPNGGPLNSGCAQGSAVGCTHRRLRSSR